MQALIGKRIQQIFMAVDRQLIVFDTDQGPVSYEVEGDCCSYSKFTDLTGISNLIGSLVQAGASETPYGRQPGGEVGVEQLEVVDERDDGGDEYVQIYRVAIRTEAGSATLTFKNWSNGYYGGMMYRTEEPLDKLLMDHGQVIKIESDDWTQLETIVETLGPR